MLSNVLYSRSYSLDARVRSDCKIHNCYVDDSKIQAWRHTRAGLTSFNYRSIGAVLQVPSFEFPSSPQCVDRPGWRSSALPSRERGKTAFDRRLAFHVVVENKIFSRETSRLWKSRRKSKVKSVFNGLKRLIRIISTEFQRWWFFPRFPTNQAQLNSSSKVLPIIFILFFPE